MAKQITSKYSFSETTLLFFSFCNWQLAQHVEKIIGDIIAPSRVLEIWQPLSLTLGNRGSRQGNRVEEEKKKTNETFKTLLTGWLGARA